MAKKGRQQRRIVLSYPGHLCPPEDLLHFVESTEFTSAWKSLGLDDEDDLLGLQLAVMAAPKRPPVVQGTDGLRKLRFAPRKWGVGKRGAVRVCYVYFAEFGIVYLVVAYGKNERDDLTPAERAAIRQEIRGIKSYLAQRGAIN